MTAAIEIYTRPGCGYCGAAKSLLMRKKAAFVEFDVAKDAAFRQEMWDRAGAGSTFPQIFIGEMHVGGGAELYALYPQRQLHAASPGEKSPLRGPSSSSTPPSCPSSPATRRAPHTSSGQNTH